MTVSDKHLSDLIYNLASVKERIKYFEKEEASLKKEIMEKMLELGSASEATDEGTVRLQSRSEKVYGDSIRQMETELKEAKKLADDMGDFTIVGTKESLIFTPPKSIF